MKGWRISREKKWFGVISLMIGFLFTKVALGETLAEYTLAMPSIRYINTEGKVRYMASVKFVDDIHIRSVFETADGYLTLPWPRRGLPCISYTAMI